MALSSLITRHRRREDNKQSSPDRYHPNPIPSIIQKQQINHQRISYYSHLYLFVLVLLFGFVSSFMFFPSRFLPTAAFLTTTTIGSLRKNLSTAVSASTVVSNSCLAMSSSSSSSNCKNMQEEFSSIVPMIGLGTMGITDEQMDGAIHSALRIGYRRIDCAPVYFNEKFIGDAFDKEGLTTTTTTTTTTNDSTTTTTEETKNVLKREDLFIVSKLASVYHRKEHVKIGLQKTLNDLNLKYLDLFIIHWPQAFYYVPIDINQRGYNNEDIDDSNNGKNIDPTISIHETWEAMEELVTEGLVKYIGVSNFPVSLLHELLTKSKIHPVVNQIEIHPYLQQNKLVNYCKARNIHVQGYSPLGTPGYKEDNEPNILQDPILLKIAKRHNVTVAQVCISWTIHQRNISIVVKSSSSKRQEENYKGYSTPIQFTKEEIKEIESLDRGYRYFRPDDWWGDMAMAVFD